ncbi:MAG: cysteine hydrolase family protein [Myxococcota bacterium]
MKTLSEVAVLFLDHQDNLVDLSKTCPPDQIRRVAGVVAQTAKICKLPCFASVVPFGVSDPKPIASITEHLPSMGFKARHGASAMAHEPSLEAIRALNRPHLVVSGVFSEIVVFHTVQDALSMGYRITILADACAGFDPRSEDAALHELRALGASVRTTPTFASSYVTTWESTDGQALGGAIASLLN